MDDSSRSIYCWGEGPGTEEYSHQLARRPSGVLAPSQLFIISSMFSITGYIISYGVKQSKLVSVFVQMYIVYIYIQLHICLRMYNYIYV